MTKDNGAVMRSILYLCEYGTLNGGENSLLSILPHVIAAGWRPTVLGPSEGNLAAAVQATGASFAVWDVTDAEGRKRPLEQLRAELQQLIERHRPAMVHANSLSMSRVLGPVETPGVIKVGHLRDIIKLNRQVITDLNQLDARIAVSNATRDFHVAQGLDEATTHVIYNGVDPNKFFPGEPTGYLHRELGLPLEKKLVAFIGQIGMRKGIEVALRAFSDHGDAHLLVIGDRFSQKEEAVEYEASLREIVAARNLAAAVTFLPFRTDMPELLRELTLLVHPARQEPLGRVLLEAAATGLAVVATDAGGTREIFGDDAAEIVSIDDVSAMAAAIDRLIFDPAYRSQLGGKSHQRSRLFTPTLSALHILALYDELLARS
ncbi:glycosyltransferase family 4 protein [Blastopirellula sp. JC732]|uniref:Glycosyltransferase family 4 protein n=1 Tax=Blastopirellula sediminis TaxID=2894196 RepID=A0A9X1SEB7_9BACT|nr:glycosyltransferase family 4 protein [Blastopirellula sediminis]MCC9608134.1 glycosyltransferase family 4 protein [Blastopirellula sediminis]MCC9627073.1 glycosyltransferase family 4 protein [Blastopirellula sediminis]